MPPKTSKPRNSNRRYVRNITRAQVVLRFQGNNERRVVLNPRGQRGDLQPIVVGEINQLPDVDVLYEIITEHEGKEILAKQTTNQQAFHPAIDILRNAKGERYEKAVVMEAKEAVQGHLVARVESNDAKEGNRKNITVEPIERVNPPEQVTRPGSIGYEPSANNPMLDELGIDQVRVEPTQKGKKS